MGFFIFWSVIALIVIFAATLWMLKQIFERLFYGIKKSVEIYMIKSTLIEKLGYDHKTAKEKAKIIWHDSHKDEFIEYED